MRKHECAMVAVSEEDSETGRDELYILFGGVRIAKRGYPDSPQARTWIPLEPGFAVYDGPNDHAGNGSLIIEGHGIQMQ